MITADTKHTVDPSTFTITFKRSFSASREDVFEAWTDSEQVAQWWDPTGARLTACVIDLRPGGAFKFVNEGHGPPFAGVYQVVERPSLLSFEAMGALGTVRLEDERGTTQMTVTIRCGSKEHLEQFVKLGVAVNTDRTFDNLVAHMSKKAA
jgi:uncharacterized protein YndB with AHSA1/START domain